MVQEQKLGSQGIQRLHKKLHDQGVPHNCFAYDQAVRKQLMCEMLNYTGWTAIPPAGWTNWEN